MLENIKLLGFLSHVIGKCAPFSQKEEKPFIILISKYGLLKEVFRSDALSLSNNKDFCCRGGGDVAVTI